MLNFTTELTMFIAWYGNILVCTDTHLDLTKTKLVAAKCTIVDSFLLIITLANSTS